MEVLCIGDVMIPGDNIGAAAKTLRLNNLNIDIKNWETDWGKLQDRRLIIEKQGPSAESVVPQILNANKDTEMLLVLFCPVSKKLSGFQVNILVFDPYVSDEVIQKYHVQKVTIEDLLKNADFVSLHARLNKDSKNVIGEKELSLMKKNAYLINTARAGLINEDALYHTLKKKKIAGAALDVFWQEPIGENSRWLELDNVTLTTHIAGTTKEALTKSPYLLVEDINKLLENKNPKFIVNLEVLKRTEVQKWLKEVRSWLDVS